MDANGSIIAKTNLTAEGFIALKATSKLFLDGISGAGDTYIFESSANVATVVAGGVSALSINATQAIFSNSTDLIIGATKKLLLDGGGDTYIHEQSANLMQFVAAGTAVAELRNQGINLLASQDLVVVATQKIRFDGSFAGDTYIYESSSNVLDLFVGGSLALRSTTTLVQTGASHAFAVPAAQKVFLDGGGNTSIRESSADIIAFEVNGSDKLTINGTAVTSELLNVVNTNQTTGIIFNIANADSLTTGSIANFVSNSSNTSVRNLVNIHNDNSAATSATCLSLTQDASENALLINYNATSTGGGIALNVGSGAGSTSYGIEINNLGLGSSIQINDDGLANSSFEITKTVNTASTVRCILLRGSNASGSFTAIDMNDSSFDYFIEVPNDTNSVGSNYGRIPIWMNGLKYLQVFNP